MYEPPGDTNFDDVGRFHAKFGLPVSMDTPKHPSRDLLEFRIKFLLEEVLEFAVAAGYEITIDPPLIQGEPGMVNMLQFTKDVDHEKMFDALLDEAYVVFGTAHLLGYPWQRGWELVQEANMAKVRAQADGSDSLRGSSFDVVKPEGWVAPDIAGLLRECGWGINYKETVQ